MDDKLFVRVSRWIWYAVAFTLTIVTIYVSLGRILFPGIAAYKDDIASELSQLLDANVVIGAIEGRWNGFDPVIELLDVRIDSPAPAPAPALPASNNLLEISRMTIQPNMLASLLSANWQMQKILVGDININLQQTGGGFSSVEQIYQLVTGSVGQTESLDWAQLTSILKTPTFEFEKLQLHWQEDGRTLLDLAVPSMVLQVGEVDLAVSGFIHQPNAHRPLGKFSVIGNGVQQDSFDGTVYFNWQNSDFLTPLIDWLAQRGTILGVNQSEGEIWLNFEKSAFSNGVVALHSNSFDWQQGLACMLPVEGMSGLFSFQKQLAGWTLAASNLILDWAGESLGPQKVLISSIQKKDSNRAGNDIQSTGDQLGPGQHQSVMAEGYAATIDSVNMSQLRRLLMAIDTVPEAIVRPLQSYSPAGELNNFQLEIWPSRNQFSFAALLRDVSVQAHRGAPSIADLNGYIFLNEREGFVDFNSKNLELGFPDLYHQAWRFEQAEGRVDWQIDEQAVRVSGDQLKVLNPSAKAGKVSGGFSINIPHERPTRYFELSLLTEEIDASLAAQFVPGRMIDEGAYDWLRTAFSKGLVQQGTFLFSGQVGGNTRKEQARSELALEFSDLALQFHPNWPQLNDVEGKLEVKDNQITGQFSKASIGGTRINNASLLLNNFNSGTTSLEIIANARPKAKDWQFWLHRSPAAEHIRDAAGDWKVSGQADIEFRYLTDFDEDIPIIRTTVNASKLNLSSEGLGLDIKDVAGLVTFDNKRGFFGERLSGVFLEQRLQGSLDTSLWNEHEKSLDLSLSSRMTDGELALLLATDVKLPISGAFNYNLDLNIATGSNTDLQYSISTDLVGLGIQAPPPYGKPEQEARELKLSRFWSFDNQQGRWGLDIKGWFDVNLLDGVGFRDGEIDTGLVRFGHQGKYKLPESGIEFVGDIPEADLLEWQSFISDFSPAANQDGPLPDWLSGFQVNIGQLTVGTETFNNADISGILIDPTVMSIGVKDEGRIDGQIHIPLARQHNLKVSLAKLYLSPVGYDLTESELVPQDIPLVDVSIGDLRIGEKLLGSWSWQAEKRDRGVVFNNVEARLPGATYTGRLSWLYDEEINVHTSILTGGFQGRKFEEFSTLWTDRPPLNSEAFDISTGIVWGRRPTEFSWEYVTGKLSFNMYNGALNDTSASADVFRIFGILNTDALTRRLRLDFSDLYEEGLAYDHIEGNARIQEGLVRFESPLAVQAPSSAFKITGTTSLVDDSLDMDMVVVLPLTKNLPLAGLLVGAPQIGGAVFLIDQLLGEPLSSLTSATYHITGTLQEPDIKLAQVFEKRNSKSSPNGKRRLEKQD